MPLCGCCQSLDLCGCCTTADLSSEPFVDADRVLKEFAWKKASLRWWQRLCPGQLELEVNWSYLNRKHELQRFTCRATDQPHGSKEHQKTTKEVTRDLCLFRTQFTNVTDLKQTYAFRAERETSSTCHVSVQKSFTIGGKLDVKFSIPLPGEAELKAALQDKVDLCDVTGGLSGQFQLTDTHGETFTERLTWSVDTHVDVAPHTKTTASLVIKEKSLEADYSVLTTITPNREGVTVYFRDKKSHDVVTKVEILREDFASVFKDKGIFQADPEKDPRSVMCLTRGTCRAVYGAEQLIHVSHEKLGAGDGNGAQKCIVASGDQSEACIDGSESGSCARCEEVEVEEVEESQPLVTTP